MVGLQVKAEYNRAAVLTDRSQWAKAEKRNPEIN